MRKMSLGEKELLFEKKEGYIIYKLDGAYCDINFIEVDSAEKNSGHGTMIMHSFFETMSDKGIKEYFLEAYEVDRGIHSISELVLFYQKFDFKEVDRMVDDEDKERVFMVKKV
jgi:ribosomal protein S18 acetylase RimI-like enzyme